MKIRNTLAAIFLLHGLNAQVIQPTMKRLPDTGQTQGFTETYGEDNDYSINMPAFTDHGDGTITDTITGLMWQKADGGEMKFESARAYADSLHLAGHSNWRLPLPQEIVSIFNHQKNNPAMDVNYFPSTGAEYWWTSVRQTGDTSKVWCGNAGGGIGNHLKTETISAGGTKKFHVKAVRDVQPPGFVPEHFTDNGDGSIRDNLTGLVWQKNPSSAALTWEQALSTAENLSLAGFDDWRLPNIKELYSIHDPGRTSPAANPVLGLQSVAKYWSSTSIPGQQGVKAWYFDTRFGITTYDLKTASYPIIAVRGPGSLPTETVRHQAAEALRIFPNPSASGREVRGLMPGEYFNIFNAGGKTVYSGKADGPLNMTFSPGLYLLRTSEGRSLKLVQD